MSEIDEALGLKSPARIADKRILKFPKSRIATLDIGAVGKMKHHIPALLEVDITVARKKIREIRRTGKNLSLTSWLVRVIGLSLKEYEEVSAYLSGKGSRVIFEHINVSLAVEKVINGTKVPLPVVIREVELKTAEAISKEIEAAKSQSMLEKDIVLSRQSARYERFYYYLPGYMRRMFWRFMIRKPSLAYRQMGNVSLTSVSMMGQVNGWFVPISVHPVCFGFGGISMKPVVRRNEIVIREMLNMTILFDHDVVDGANMARFVKKLSDAIEKGEGLNE